MSQIVVDSDVASYIFNLHSLSQRYIHLVRGSESHSVLHVSCGIANGRDFGTTTYVRFGPRFAPVRGRRAGH